MIKNLTCDCHNTLLEVMNIINENGMGVCFVTDEFNSLKGIVTDSKTGAIMTGVKVQLIANDGTSNEVETDNTGKYELLNAYGLDAGDIAKFGTYGAFIIPEIAVSIRRLHDINKSGWWILLTFTIIGIIPLTYFYCIKGDDNNNAYGQPN